LSFVAAIVALVVSMLLTRAFTRPGSGMHILDHPNERSLHTTPTPRTGGVAIVTGILVGGVMFAVTAGSRLPIAVGWLGTIAALIAVVSFFDDCRHLPIAVRLTAHIAASGLLMAASLGIGSLSLPGFTYALPAWPASILTILFTVWMVNLYNFMDGMDGFAGGMTSIGFGTLAVLGWWGGDGVFAALNVIIVGATIGFLVFNFPPAKIFMGDTGSSTLGFLAAGMALWAHVTGLVPLWISVVVFSPFIVDATVTLVRRAGQGEKVWQAHKTHYYQRLVQAGWGHRKTVLLEYGLMLACAGAAVAAYSVGALLQWVLMGAVAMMYIGFFQLVRAVEARSGVVPYR
jgi:UDP-N-acetylmuramyl pentapeptide phosphotransferase/UDP-N-acetylglucosamine-1-phosphate transferase